MAGWGCPPRRQPELPTGLYVGLVLLWCPIWKLEIWFVIYVKFQIFSIFK